MLRDETTSINGLTTSILSTGEEHYMRLNDLKDTGSSTISAPPKYILRQINERRALNPNPMLNENGGVGGAGLNRKKMKQSKIISPATTSSAVANLAKQQYAQQLATSSSSLATTSTSSRLQQHTNGNGSSSKSAAALTHNQSFSSKMNDEFFQTFNNVSNSNNTQTNYPISNSPANLYSSAFIAANTNTPLKTQFDKINGRQNGGGSGLVNSASSPSFLANSNNTNNILRQKINK